MQDIPSTSENLNEHDLSLLEAILQKNEIDLSLQKSDAGSRVSVLRQNGNLSRPSSLSKRDSINLSRHSLGSSKDTSIYRQEDSGITKFIFSLALLSVVALILGVVALQLLIAMSHLQDSAPLPGTLVNASSVFADMLEVGVAMVTLVVMLDLSCLMVCTMQVFFAAKILLLPEGDKRALKYLKECSSSRVIAVMGFFVSIPAFIIGLVLFMILQFQSTSAVLSTLILTSGILLSMMTILQNTYHWRVEKEKANVGFPASYDDRPPSSSAYKPAHTAEISTYNKISELSTLV